MPERSAPKGIFTVSTLAAMLRSHIETGFMDVWVEGEVSNLRMASSGHAYFTLKDSTSQMRAVMFRSVTRHVRFIFKDGICLICRGRITVYEPKGDYQMVVEYAEPKGMGALQLAFEQLKQRLAAEGLFDAARKRPLPLFPRRIGIVTSLKGAAIRDIVQVSYKRWPSIQLLLNPVGVQGAAAAGEIARAISELNDFGDLDLLIVGRGGGSFEDLWPFNEEVVARAIAASRIPVVSAVGHEIDYTIADFVSDARAPTPSAAAELALRDKGEILRRISEHAARTAQAIRVQIREWRAYIGAQRRALLDPAALVERAMQRRDDLEMRLRLAARTRVRDGRGMIESGRQSLLLQSPLRRIHQRLALLPHLQTRLTHQIVSRTSLCRRSLHEASAALHVLSPLGILARGYSITRCWPGMTLIHRASEVVRGDAVHVRLGAGELICEVRQVNAESQPLKVDS